MGTVEIFRELDTNLSRDVAIEILLATLAQDRVARFGRKNKALTAMNHSNIAIISGSGYHRHDVRASGEEGANETDNFADRSGSFDPG